MELMWFKPNTVDTIVAPLNDIVNRLHEHVDAMTNKAVDHRDEALRHHGHADLADGEAKRASVIAENIVKLLSGAVHA
jgi:hypothetical protein